MTDAAESAEGPEQGVRVERRGALGLLTLDRPRALNALTHAMVRRLAEALAAWADADGDGVRTVAIVGAGDRGLCAGGDVVTLARDVTEGDGTGAAAFWRDEYRLNLAIARFPKPVVAVQDGVVLGGGVGISGHASHRLVTERTRIGFPEVAIGFVPDVGGTWLLTRAPGELGTRLAMTGTPVGPGDALLLGLADRFVPSERLPALLAALETDDVDDAVRSVQADPPAGELAAVRSVTDAAFAGDDVGAILERLRRSGDPAAGELAATIEQRSPLAVAVTLAALRRGRTLPSLAAALDQEYRTSRRSSQHPDFVEGIRAQLVDKDRNPRWDPATHDEVEAADVDAHFTTPPEGDLGLAGPADADPSGPATEETP